MSNQSPTIDTFFTRLQWQPDRMVLDDLVFRLQHYKSDAWDGGDHFLFFKIKELIDQYEMFFEHHPEFHPTNILELGIWDGGSTAFWFELFQPRKHVAVDLTSRCDSPYFERYVSSRHLSDRVKTYWNTNQADQARLARIVSNEFDGPLDLVVDDASHLYWPTLKSFEAIFPRVRPAGMYIIEDWAWGHWPEFFDPSHVWADQEPLTRLVIELIEATGTSEEVVRSVTVHQGFVVAIRGPKPIEAPFVLADCVKRRPERISVRNLARRLKGKLR
jgi:hypothetical protein